MTSIEIRLSNDEPIALQRLLLGRVPLALPVAPRQDSVNFGAEFRCQRLGSIPKPAVLAIATVLDDSKPGLAAKRLEGRRVLGQSLLVLVLLLMVAWCRVSAAQDDPQALFQQAVRDSVAAIADTVVRIETIGGSAKSDSIPAGTGPTTGTIVDADGLIVSSSFNFLQEPSAIFVTLPNGNRARAKIVGRDEHRQLVLLRVESGKPLPVCPLADKSSLQVGQTSIAVGRTISDDGPNLSVGIISALNRVWGRAIQTDAKISPMNYGGPLVDLRGRMIGILVPMSPDSTDTVAGVEWYDSGIGFAVPIADVMKNLDAMDAGQTIKPGLLGISLKGDNRQVDRAIVSNCLPNSPAYDAGFKAGDEIVEIDAITIRNQVDMKHAIGNRDAGETVRMTVVRKIDGNKSEDNKNGATEERIERELELAAEVLPYDQPFLGILPERTESIVDENDADESQGVRVRYVFKDGAADAAGLQVGDLIREFDGEPVTNSANLVAMMRAFQAGDEVELVFEAGGEQQTRETKLQAVSLESPDLNPAKLLKARSDAPQYETGTVEIKIVAEENRAVAIVPENLDEFLSVGLVVLTDTPGKVDKQQLKKEWQSISNARGLIVVAVEPLDESRWSPVELGFVRKLIGEAGNRYPVDPRRVATYGRQSGGAFAFLAALAHRDLIRGVLAIDGNPPGRMRPPIVEPNQPLAIFWSISDEKKADAFDTMIEVVRERKFPLLFRSGKSESDLKAEILDWVETLDRI